MYYCPDVSTMEESVGIHVIPIRVMRGERRSTGSHDVSDLGVHVNRGTVVDGKASSH